MMVVLYSTIFFYYLALTITGMNLVASCYISEKYLFAVAQNVSFLKRFAGL
jgi:hypothetical protein